MEILVRGRMREEYYSLSRLWGGGDLSLRWKPVRNVFGQVSGRLKLVNILLRDGGGHPLASRSGHAADGPTEKVRTWALGLESARTDEQRRKKAWVKAGDPCPFIKAVKNVRLPTCLSKSLILQVPRLMARLGYHTRIDEDPAIRGTRSLLRQDVPRKPPRDMCSRWF